MSYVVIYEQETSGDYGTDWVTGCERFDSYESLVSFIAHMELRYPKQYRWINIFKVEDCMLELYWKDIQEEFEKQERRLEAKRIYNENEATREKELLKKLLEKYGDLS